MAETVFEESAVDDVDRTSDKLSDLVHGRKPLFAPLWVVVADDVVGTSHRVLSLQFLGQEPHRFNRQAILVHNVSLEPLTEDSSAYLPSRLQRTEAGGADMKLVQALLRHSSLAITADTYTSVLPEVAREATEAAATLC